MILTYLAITLRVLSNPFSNVFQKKLTGEGHNPLVVNFISYLLLSVACRGVARGLGVASMAVLDLCRSGRTVRCRGQRLPGHGTETRRPVGAWAYQLLQVGSGHNSGYRAAWRTAIADGTGRGGNNNPWQLFRVRHHRGGILLTAAAKP